MWSLLWIFQPFDDPGSLQLMGLDGRHAVSRLKNAHLLRYARPPFRRGSSHCLQRAAHSQVEIRAWQDGTDNV
jgi:hypothetical protein